MEVEGKRKKKKHEECKGVEVGSIGGCRIILTQSIYLVACTNSIIW